MLYPVDVKAFVDKAVAVTKKSKFKLERKLIPNLLEISELAICEGKGPNPNEIDFKNLESIDKKLDGNSEKLQKRD